MRRAFFAAAILLVSISAYADRVVTHHFESAMRAPAVRRVIVEIPAGEILATVPRADVKVLDASVMVGEVHARLGDSSVNNEGVFPGRIRWENPSGGRGRVYLHTTVGEIHVQLTR